jgi:hypothetical protein
MRKIALIILTLNFLGCDQLPKDYPKEPQVTYWGVFADLADAPAGFYGPSEQFREFTDPQMKASQCLTADDSKKAIEWSGKVKSFVIERCECK